MENSGVEIHQSPNTSAILRATDPPRRSFKPPSNTPLYAKDMVELPHFPDCTREMHSLEAENGPLPSDALQHPLTYLPPPVEAAAASLGRPVFLVDDDGYECEIIGAAVAESGDLAYVESRAKDVGPNQYGAYQREIDISIRAHLIDASGTYNSADIESYNPFFGCDIRFLNGSARRRC